jgi:hypothetical protein
MPLWFWLVALLPIALAVLAGAILVLYPPRVPIARARAEFDRHRTELETQFFEAASHSGKPRGLRWTRCEGGPAVEFARDRRTGQLLALVGVTISFEAIEGSDMEGLPAVGNLRNASAVFILDGLRWSTDGRTVFNLNPDEAIQHFGSQYERVV